MMAPFDTALLRHRADHLRQPTDAERTAMSMWRSNRPTFREFVAQVFDCAPRYGTGNALGSPTQRHS